MRVRLSTTSINQNGFLDIIPPLFDINDKINLKTFKVSKTTVAPFEEFIVEWEIESKMAHIKLDDYEFRLRSHNKLFGKDLPTSGIQRISIDTNSLLTLETRKKNSGNNFIFLGNSITMTLDLSKCTETKEIPDSIFNGIFINKIEESLGDIAQLRLRSPIVSNWFNRYIEVHLPLEMVIPSFFNGNLDIKIKITFRVDHEQDGSYLDVTLTSTEDADFHLLEDILSLGSTAAIAKTVESLIPIILKPILKDAETEIVTGLHTFLNFGNFLDDYRLLGVTIIPETGFSYLKFQFCEKPQNDNGIVFTNGVRFENVLE